MKDFLTIVGICLAAALYIHFLFCFSSEEVHNARELFKKFISRHNLVVVALCALYVACLIEATWVVGSGWVFIGGLVIPLAWAFMKAALAKL